MTFKRAADGIVQKGKTDGKNLGNSGPTQKEMMGGKGAGKGKTNANMKAMGRGLAKIAAQKRG
jgi:hypothetical protein